jgi:hypothetical protein
MLLAMLAAIGVPACATSPAPSAGEEPVAALFGEPDTGDPFFARIRLWQASERLAALRGRPAATFAADAAAGLARAAPAQTSPRTALAASLEDFERAQRERAVETTLRWVQAQSRTLYRPDAGGEHWPALDDLLREGEDDCDGLELLTFALLRRQGFTAGELYRAIVWHPERDAYHMVTLWMRPRAPALPAASEPGAAKREEPAAPASRRPAATPAPQTEAIVLDPTGWITARPVPLSAIRPWVPLRLFDETAQWSARGAPRIGADAPVQREAPVSRDRRRRRP